MEFKIGPSFPFEVLAVGASLDGVQWQPDLGTVQFNADVPQATQAAILGVLARHDPTKLPPLQGCAIVSVGSPGISGTYAIDAASLQKVAATAQYIALNQRFPAGQAQLAWPDAGGQLHLFQAPAAFLAFATAIADYVALLDIQAAAAAVGQNVAGPTSPVQIP